MKQSACCLAATLLSLTAASAQQKFTADYARADKMMGYNTTPLVVRSGVRPAARTLQWISEPDRAVGQMKRAAKAGGCVVILDYNLEDTRWEPDPPADFKRFYRAFLDWRTANDWDNRMAEHLPELFHSAGLSAVEVHPCDEIVQRGESDFLDAYASGIWRYVIQSLGPQLVHDGFLKESERCDSGGGV